MRRGVWRDPGRGSGLIEVEVEVEVGVGLCGRRDAFPMDADWTGTRGSGTDLDEEPARSGHRTPPTMVYAAGEVTPIRADIRYP
jgi:hypothetical protein